MVIQKYKCGDVVLYNHDDYGIQLGVVLRGDFASSDYPVVLDVGDYVVRHLVYMDTEEYRTMENLGPLWVEGQDTAAESLPKSNQDTKDNYTVTLTNAELKLVTEASYKYMYDLQEQADKYKELLDKLPTPKDGE